MDHGGHHNGHSMSNGHSGHQSQMQNTPSSSTNHATNTLTSTTTNGHSQSTSQSQSQSQSTPNPNPAKPDVNALAQQTWNALLKLYDQKTSPEDRRNADHFLGKVLPNQMSCWQVFATFLNTKNSPHPVHFFAANMLRSKIQRNLHQVPKPQHQGLHDMLLNALIEFNHKGKEVLIPWTASIHSLSVHIHRCIDCIDLSALSLSD